MQAASLCSLYVVNPSTVFVLDEVNSLTPSRDLLADLGSAAVKVVLPSTLDGVAGHKDLFYPWK